MNLYSAFMRAADKIRQLGAYDFTEIKIPGPNGEGCVLGWIGHYAGLPAGVRVAELAGWREQTGLLGMSEQKFFARLHALEHWWEPSFIVSARTASKVMRRYAARYLQKPQLRTDVELVADLVGHLQTNPVPEAACSQELTWA